MKKLIPILLAVFALSSCEKDPDMGKLDDNYLVYTNYDKKANFKDFTKFYLADKILIISDSEEPEYLEGQAATDILAAYTKNMEAKGYQAVTQEEADLGIQVSYISSTYYFTSYGQPEWWWGYPGYWNPGYWGDWGGWYYPYSTTYSYSTNSFLTEMVNLKAAQGETKKLPVVWTSYLTGFDTGSSTINRTLAVQAVNQSFTQSPYLTNK